MREFTTLEKDLLRRIESGEGKNLYSLIAPWMDGISFRVDRKSKRLTMIFETVKNEPDRVPFTVRWRVGMIETVIVQAVNLIKLFSDRGYFFVLQTFDGLQDEFTFGQAAMNKPSIPMGFADPRVSDLFCQYASIDIVVTPELKKFINDDFKSREEVRADRQYKLTRMAFKLAFAALVLNLSYNVYRDYIDDGARNRVPLQEQIMTQSKHDTFHSGTGSKAVVLSNESDSLALVQRFDSANCLLQKVQSNDD